MGEGCAITAHLNRFVKRWVAAMGFKEGGLCVMIDGEETC